MSDTRAPWLRAITVGYLAWSLVPIAIAISYSFNTAPSVTRFDGFSLGLWRAIVDGLRTAPEIRAGLRHSVVLAALTALIAVPSGVGLALALRHLDRRFVRAVETGTLLAIAVPALLTATMLWQVFAYPLRRVPFEPFGWFGMRAQVVGLVTMMLPIVVLLTWVAFSTVDLEQEEMAADLGAPPTAVITAVIAPQIAGPLALTAGLVFSLALNEFVVVGMLVSMNEQPPMSVWLYGARFGPEPFHSAIGTLLGTIGAAVTLALWLVFGRRSRR